jgi:hypothetical protein
MKKLRDLLNRNPALGYGAAAVPLVLAVLITLFNVFFAEDEDEPFRVRRLWFYDLNTSELFDVPVETNAPIEAPSRKPFEGEPAGVRAYVYGCGSCEKTFIGYLEKYTPEAKKIHDESQKHDSNTVGKARQEGALLRRVSDSGWVRNNTPEAGKIKVEVVGRCGKERVVTCYPR